MNENFVSSKRNYKNFVYEWILQKRLGNENGVPRIHLKMGNFRPVRAYNVSSGLVAAVLANKHRKLVLHALGSVLEQLVQAPRNGRPVAGDHKNRNRRRRGAKQWPRRLAGVVEWTGRRRRRLRRGTLHLLTSAWKEELIQVGCSCPCLSVDAMK